MGLPAHTAQMVDANGRITPTWRRTLSQFDQVLSLFETQDTKGLVEDLKKVKEDLELTSFNAVNKAKFEAEQGRAETALEEIRDTLLYFGEEVQKSVDVSTNSRVQIDGEREARLQQVRKLEAKSKDVSASVTDLEQVVVTEQSATASKFSQVQTELDGNSAAITQIDQSVDGIEAKRILSIESNGQVVGSRVIGGGLSGSYVDFLVNVFRLVHPNGGAPIPIFVATLDENGAPAVSVNGLVSANNITAGTIQGVIVKASVFKGNKFESDDGTCYLDFNNNVKRFEMEF